MASNRRIQVQKGSVDAPKIGGGSTNPLVQLMMAQQKKLYDQQMDIDSESRKPSVAAETALATQKATSNLDVEDTGRKKAVTDAATAIIALRKLIPILNEFESGFSKAYPEAKSQKGIAGKFQAAKKIFSGRVLENDPEFAAFADALEGKRSQITKGLGEVGNLAEQEQKVAMQNVPELKMGGIGDLFLPEAPATGSAKIPNFRKFVNDQMKQNMDVINSGGRFNTIEQQSDQDEDPKTKFLKRKGLI